MSIFSKLRKSAASDVSDAVVRQPGVAELIGFDGGAAALVLGLTWRTIVSKGIDAAALKLAKQHKATHFIVREQQVGWAKLPKSNDLPGRLYPLSAVTARQHPSDSLYIIDLGEVEPGMFWLATTRGGSPTSTDYVLRGIGPHDALAQARSLMEKMGEDGHRLVVYTNIDHHGFDNAESLSLQGLIDAANVSDQVLQAMPTVDIRKNKPLIIGFAVVTLGLVGNEAYNRWSEGERLRLAALSRSAAVDPQVEWGKAIDKWQLETAAPRASTLSDVIEQLYKVPVHWNGWILTQAACNAGLLSGAALAAPDPAPAPAAQGVADSLAQAVASPAVMQGASLKEAWSCSAMFERKPKGALNRDMASKIPEGWAVSYTPLNQMVLSWGISVDAQAIDIERLPTVLHHNVESSSHLQRLQPAFQEEPKFAFMPVEIPAPKAEDGSALPPDQRIQQLKRSPFQLRGPLRSMEAVAATGVEVAWRSASIIPDPQNHKPGLNSSVLMAEATGVLYANK